MCCLRDAQVTDVEHEQAESRSVEFAMNGGREMGL